MNTISFTKTATPDWLLAIFDPLPGLTLINVFTVLWISLFMLFAGLSVTRAQPGANADVVTAISNLENDAVKADLAGDIGFYQKLLAEDWTRGDSDGTFYTKADVLKLMADTKTFKTNSEKLSELKVRVYGDTAVATYKDTYDILIKGEHRAHTIIATDTFVKMGGEWKQVASHGSEAK
ncbi:MAG TPA: nuclear transport factor 2 family protein [Candidatus Udaeobacter sp.]|nr:nuclear transport factor 2 family protein [Candidatus Udaeobacter sp.]